MNLFCAILGHTWVPAVSSPDPHWHTTKKGEILVQEADEGDVRYFDRCQRCGEVRDVPRPRAADREPRGESAA